MDIGLPSGLAIHPVSGELFIASRTHCTIRRVNLSTMRTFTAAGTGGCGSSADGAAPTATTFRDAAGIAFDKLGILYVTEPHNHRIRRVDLRGTVSTFVGTGQKGFNGDQKAGTETIVSDPTTSRCATT